MRVQMSDNQQYQQDQLGFISIRNEEGTQWVNNESEWSTKKFRRAHTYTTFEKLQEMVEDSKRKRGFLGFWNLTFHPCTQEEAHEQELNADAEERAIDAAFEEELMAQVDYEIFPEPHQETEWTNEDEAALEEWEETRRQRIAEQNEY